MVRPLLALALALQFVHAPAAHADRGRDILAGAFVGLVAGAVVGTILSHDDQSAMRDSYADVCDDDVDNGYRSDFEGDGHHGYYEVVNQGYYAGYPNSRCRQIRTRIFDRDGYEIDETAQARPRVLCYYNGQGWLQINPQNYMARPTMQMSVVQNYPQYYTRPVYSPQYYTQPYYNPRPNPAVILSVGASFR